MKKIIIITSIAVWSTLFVSCTNETEEVEKNFLKQVTPLQLTITDTLSTSAGPGDETVPILPPKK